MNLEKPQSLKSTTFWKEEIEKAGIQESLSFFNDVITEKKAPHPRSGYHLALQDIPLDNKKCDIYHTDQDEGGLKISDRTFHRIFIHIKE